MGRWLGVACTSTLALVVAAHGCAARESSGGSGGSAGSGGAGASAGQDASNGGGISTDGAAGDDGGLNPDAACNKFSAEAKQAPAAILFVVDGSASMSQSQKWGTAQLATVTAIDQDAFDGVSLGLVRFPATFVDPPQCFCDFVCGCDIATCKFLLGGQGVACGVSFLPQVALADTGTEKSNQGGVRKQIYDYLVNPANGPVTDGSDASPIYDAMVAGYSALEAYQTERRVLVLITDGGFSCTSLANPARPGYSDGACPDWEQPDSVNALIQSKYESADKPIFTFVIGVPGSDSTGANQGQYATAPYNMLLALSTYAVTGAPDLVPANCDKNATFTQGGAAPAVPCHFDFSKSGFSVNGLADALKQIRGKALGCVFDLPEAPPGETLDKELVNVEVTLDGTKTTIPKRGNASDTCESSPCWDYEGEQVKLIGKACDDLTKANDAKVEIYVGCKTIVK